MSFCTKCGADLADAAFCTTCGAPAAGASDAQTMPRDDVVPTSPPVVQPVVPPVVPPLFNPTPPSRKGAGALLVGILVGALVVAAGALGGWYFMGRDSGEPASAESPVAPASGPSASVVAPVTEAPASVSCWDGSTAAEAGSCAPVTGTAGMRWVFPSLDAGWDQCDPTPLKVKGETRIGAYRCAVTVSSGSAVIIYSEYRSAEGLASSYAQRYGGVAPSVKGDLGQYGPTRVAPSGDQAFYATYVYADSDRWAVTAAGPDSSVASEALATVRMRPHAELE